MNVQCSIVAEAAMRVGGDRLAAHGGLRHGHLDLGRGEPRLPGRRADRGQVAARRHDLQQVGARPQVLPGDMADVLLGVGLAAHVPAVASRVGDRPGRHD